MLRCSVKCTPNPFRLMVSAHNMDTCHRTTKPEEKRTHLDRVYERCTDKERKTHTDQTETEIENVRQSLPDKRQKDTHRWEGQTENLRQSLLDMGRKTHTETDTEWKVDKAYQTREERHSPSLCTPNNHVLVYNIILSEATKVGRILFSCNTSSALLAKWQVFFMFYSCNLGVEQIPN